jgi:hypothetical protein
MYFSPHRPANAQRVYEAHFAPPQSAGNPPSSAEGGSKKEAKKDDKGAKKSKGDKPPPESRDVDPEKYTKIVGKDSQAKRPVGREDWQKRMDRWDGWGFGVFSCLQETRLSCTPFFSLDPSLLRREPEHWLGFGF